jgi:structural maintenance of chromosome 4
VEEVIPDSQKPSEPKGPSKRLMITHMVLENFKSYAGQIEIGPYHHVRILLNFSNL